jgi:hypothetical protein
MIHAGLPLSLLIPIVAATVPLATIFVGITFFKEVASITKILVLCTACILIGIASALE